jgi:glutamyl-tRNA synthetase
MTVRTRIAPSPTGAPHIGTAYIALFNYAFAKRHGGEFILRIEDTDQTRCTPESEQAILDALRWIGLPWSEGPDVGGGCGPYRQSERLPIYRDYVSKLVAKGAAYPCFCDTERLAQLRAQQTQNKEQPGYDGLCAGVEPVAAQKRMDAGEPYVIRMKVPREGCCEFKDRLRDEVSIPWRQVDHQVLLKSDGFPTYHLANVVDDHLMGITHVIRGEEWISSTPKHVLLYQLFGWEAPEFIHLPLLRNPDKSKLSKRKNPTSILYYQRAGILPEALINYLGGLAYSMPDGSERFTLDQLCECFDIDRVSLGGPIFDLTKLKHFNGQYIRDMDPNALLECMKGWLLNDGVWRRILPLAQPRLDALADFLPKVVFLFADQLAYAPQDLLESGMDGEQAVDLLKIAQWELEKPGPWKAEKIHGVLNGISETEEVPFKQMMALFFVAISGERVALPLFDSMEMLGRDLVLRRIQYALDALDAMSFKLGKKRLKKLESAYRQRYSARM